MAAKWMPDGKQIGYVTVFNSKYRSLHYVNPDGSGDRIEYVDSIGTAFGHFDYAWSPDGNSIAWIRSFKGGYQEIIIYNLKTGNEKQLTSERKNMDAVYWTTNNMIIFSSSKAGNTNLWCIPAGGGEEPARAARDHAQGDSRGQEILSRSRTRGFPHGGNESRVVARFGEASRGYGV